MIKVTYQLEVYNSVLRRNCSVKLIEEHNKIEKGGKLSTVQTNNLN
jgi:hypothetical protein